MNRLSLVLTAMMRQPLHSIRPPQEIETWPNPLRLHGQGPKIRTSPGRDARWSSQFALSIWALTKKLPANSSHRPPSASAELGAREETRTHALTVTAVLSQARNELAWLPSFREDEATPLQIATGRSVRTGAGCRPAWPRPKGKLCGQSRSVFERYTTSSPFEPGNVEPITRLPLSCPA